MKRRSFTSFEEMEKYLNDIPKFTSKHTIEETRAFLKKMGNPDLEMKIIHVAGTNGKGSTCAYIASVIREAGYHVALFTSPHLVDVCERFNIDGMNISHEEFMESFMAVYDMLDWELPENEEGYHPTYFEYLFFMAMHSFSKARVEWCVLETGLGGLLDATNSVQKKEVAVIARIGLDHVEYLGNTLTEIAGQKAGIIAKGVPVVYNDYVPEASCVFEQSGEKLFPINAESVSICGKSSEKIDFFMVDGYYKNVSVSLHTNALYQIENASLAIRAIEVAFEGERISAETLQRGIEKCFWAGRMEEIVSGVFIDGAHNPDGIRAFLETVAADDCSGKRSLLFGVVADKNYRGMIEMFVASGLFSEIVITPLQTGRSADISVISDVLVNDEKTACIVAGDAFSGLKAMIAKRSECGDENDRIYVAGSLYLVGEIKKAFGA